MFNGSGLPCIHPLAQGVIGMLAALVVLELTIGVKILSRQARLALVGVEIALSLLALWLGSYPFSPLGFSDGRIPLLNGFTVTTRTKGSLYIVPGGIVTLSSGLPVFIEPAVLPVEARCNWFSTNGGVFDGSQDCATFYSPPAAENDILRVNFQPGCGLPGVIGQLKISILP